MRPEVLGILPNIPSSIRAPTWDTTGSNRHLHPSSLRFNPRVPHGTRRGTYSSGRIPAAVSIHAPAEGATAQANAVTSVAGFQSTRPRRARRSTPGREHAGNHRFNPRARGGRDPQPLAPSAHPWLFQSTRPRRARPKPAAMPRSAVFVSIHAPAEGATIAGISGKIGRHVSIHAPAEGATIRCANAGIVWQVSIHAPAEGATLPVRLNRHPGRVSIHAPAEGATHVFHLFRGVEAVSIHAPAEGAT